MKNSNNTEDGRWGRYGVLCPADDEGEEETSKRRRVAEDQGADDEVKQDEDQGEEEARSVKAPPVPATPSKAEVAQHRLTHRPFRSWCPHCVRGKGRADKHRKSSQKDDETAIPKLCSDYFFIGRRRPLERKERKKRKPQREKGKPRSSSSKIRSAAPYLLTLVLAKAHTKLLRRDSVPT